MAVPVFEEATPIYATGDPGVTVDYGDLSAINADDILIIRGLDADNDSFTVPAGWNLETGAEHTSHSNCSDVWMWKRATGSESGTFSFTTQLTSGSLVMAIMERYSGCITSGNPIEQFLDTAVLNSNTCTIPAITTIGTNVLLIVHNNVEDNKTTAQATDYTERYDVSTSFGSDGAFQLQTRDMASIGSVVERTCTISASDYHGVFLIALKGVNYVAPPNITTCPNWVHTETGIVCDGSSFGASKGSGKLEMGDNATYGSANLVEQTTTTWGDVQIIFTGSLGGQSSGSKWMYVTDNSSEVSAAFAVTVSPNTPLISDVEIDEDFSDKDTNITISGTYFLAPQVSGLVMIGDDSDFTIASVSGINQTTTSWGDTLIDITVNLSTQNPGSKWLFVTNNDGYTNDPGFVVVVHRAHAFQMSASDNIATSGENTTVQLTAPATKTTGDFSAGRIQEDENPADTVDISVDDYTEMEWCLKALTNSREVKYDFRIVESDDTELDTYTLIPQLTIIVEISGRPRILMVI